MAKAKSKVTITAVPRKDFPGFGAIKAYFPNEIPVTLEVSAEELAELQGDPAKYFLKVEEAEPDAKVADPDPRSK
jgi:hypothetical protein